jgi:threonine dehydratase
VIVDSNAIHAAAKIVYTHMTPTPQYCWPMLCRYLAAEVWVKHENHTPTGAFKVRGGLVYFDHLAQSQTLQQGVISATRGNHGQSIGFAARCHGVAATIVVPRGNSPAKNEAMRAMGVKLVEHGEDFQAAREHAQVLAVKHGLHLVPAYHPLLVAGVATYGHELLSKVSDLDAVYVPIGIGSGISAMMAVRDVLGLKTAVIGVVSAHARAYAASFQAKSPIEAPAQTSLADGLACRVPEPAALEVICKGVERIVEVTDTEVAAAMRLIFDCTHNVAEGAGAAALAAVMQERDIMAGKKIAVVLSGGNVDRDVYAAVLGE